MRIVYYIILYNYAYYYVLHCSNTNTIPILLPIYCTTPTSQAPTTVTQLWVWPL